MRRVSAVVLSLFLGALSVRAEPLSIQEFRQRAPSTGEFELLGYVAKQQLCPPCPAGIACKPCMHNSILVSSVSEVLSEYPSAGEYLVIFTDDPKGLELGKRYIFTVEVLNTQSTGYGSNDLRLRAVTALARKPD